MPHLRDGSIVAKVGLRAQHEPSSLNPETNLRVPHPSQSYRDGWDVESQTGSRVPHLRDGSIVAKVGLRAQHEPSSLNPETNPRVPHPSQSYRDGWDVNSPKKSVSRPPEPTA